MRGAERGVDWAKNDSEVGRYKVSKEECLKNVGRELWVAGFVLAIEYEAVSIVDEVKCLGTAKVVSKDDVADVRIFFV